MITKAPRPASLQEESHFTPSHPTPLRRRNEITRTKKEAMCLLSYDCVATPLSWQASSGLGSVKLAIFAVACVLLLCCLCPWGAVCPHSPSCLEEGSSRKSYAGI